MWVKTESYDQVEDYARIYGFRSSPSMGSQQQVIKLQSQVCMFFSKHNKA